MPLSKAVPLRTDLPPRVLLVDDHLPILEEIRELLIPEFQVVEAVTSGPAMIAAALRWRPEVIVADIAMPDMDGIEAARRLRRLAFHGTLIFVSMNSDTEIVKAAFSAGASAYVLKIKAGTELIPAIRKALQGHTFISPSIRYKGED
ncbi:MAG: response regulator transcription factor [Acidobacteriaceae bacterium]|nr:response regulator transcription factor [Acidobacteriaceae bacterium]MBV9939945.1 response regulator transcription factor [Acidobacteriaceae bacterium]